MESIRGDWNGKVEVGKCRKRLESKEGDFKVKGRLDSTGRDCEVCMRRLES